MIRQVCLLALLVAASAGRIGMESDVLFGSAPNWSRAGRAGAEDEVTATFMLKHSDMQLAKLEETFWAVSDPKNPRYGEHLTQSQVTDLMAPSVESVNVVTDFLAAHNVSYSVGVHRDIIEASIPAAVAEDMFQTQFFHYTHARTQKSLIRAAAAYSLPSEIAAVLKLVGGLVRFPRMDGVKKVELSSENAVGWDNGCGSSCPNFVTPAILTQRYNLGSAPTSAKGSMAVSEFQGVDWDQTGLDTLKAACSLNVSLTVDKQIGSNFPLKCRVPLLGTELCAEAMLDIEYIKALGGAIPLTDIFNSQYSLESWAKQLEDMPDGTLPLVHSVSYGDDEAQQTGDAFIQAANVEFQKLGVRGISVLFASGDQGVLGRSGRGTRFHPDFPASSPYITAVGGTDFVTKSVVGDEKAWTDGGGGFSDHFAIPSYQADAVATYKTTAGSALPAQSYWNNTGRGYPDIAALGGQQNAYCISVNKALAGVAGTSAACPVAAAVFAKLNEVRLAKGGKALGFLNPFIYQNPTAFNDVTSGKNTGGSLRGFPAVKGWDAATGMGTPDFQKLSALM